MADQLYSPLWYRVARLRPALKSHTEFNRHVYRGEPWYVLLDNATGRVHRFHAAAHHFISRMNGHRSVQELWESTDATLADRAPTQTEIVELLAQLHAADLLSADIPPDAQELFHRYRLRQSRKWRRLWWSPLSIRIPLVDPNAFIERHLPRVRLLLGPIGLAVWLIFVLPALATLPVHWSDLTTNLTDRVFTAHNLVLIWATYPLIKLLHELGHAFAAKRWGAEVHEIGIMLLVFMPVPYVDASTSAVFPDKRHRMVVAGAGILVELFLAALAFWLWLAIEPGTLRAMVFNVMLIGGISTIFFNGNPLLRFDGYYVLADALEIPNLWTRSQQYVGYLFQRYLAGVAQARSPASAAGERPWLLFYAVASTIYRFTVLIGIVLFVASRFFVVGIVLALWAASTQILLPAMKRLQFLFFDRRLEGYRSRALGVSGAFLVIVAIAFLAIPVPLRTQTDGVVWAPADTEIRAGADGVITQLVATPGAWVDIGEVLLATEDPFATTRVQILEAELREAQARFQSVHLVDQLQADILREQVGTIESDLALAQQRLQSLTIRSSRAGRFIVHRPEDLVGRFIRKGDLVGYVADLSQGTVRVAVTQADIGLIRSGTNGISVRLTERIAEPVQARIVREVPAGTHEIPSPVLGTMWGGPVAVDPADESGTTTLDRVFHIELELDQPVSRLGGRTYVRFDHGTETLGRQSYRRLRQLFLRRFNAA